MNLMQTRIAKEWSRVRLSLRTLDKALRRLTPVLTTYMKASANGTANPAVRVSAKTRAAHVLQGRHMGQMRQLKPRQKVQVKKVKGIRAAITKAKGMSRP